MVQCSFNPLRWIELLLNNLPVIYSNPCLSASRLGAPPWSHDYYLNSLPVAALRATPGTSLSSLDDPSVVASRYGEALARIVL